MANKKISELAEGTTPLTGDELVALVQGGNTVRVPASALKGLQGDPGTPGTPGEDGSDGREVEMQKGTTHLQWRYVGATTWTDLVALTDLRGEKGDTGAGLTVLGELPDQSDLPASGDLGDAYLIAGHLWTWNGTTWVDAGEVQGPPGADGVDGTDGVDGREIEVQKSATHIQWRYVGDSTWTNLVALADITGPKGDPGDAGASTWDDIEGKPNVIVEGDSRLTDARAPSGGAGGVLAGTYPNPGFAVDMAEQGELDTQVQLLYAALNDLDDDKASATFTAAGTGAVTRPLMDKVRDIVSVLDFGAVGDGVTDDATAVQLAANAAIGKCLFFPPGSYNVPNGFDVVGDNTEVVGMGATIIYPATTETYYHCIRVLGDNCRIADLRIQSPSGLVRDDTGFAICVGNAVAPLTSAIVENCFIDGIGSAGIWFARVENAMASNNVVINCLADGIHFSDGCYHMTASGNILRNNGDDNIAIVNSVVGSPYVGSFAISGNEIYGSRGPTGMGVALIGAVSGSVTGNTIGNTIGPGISTYVWLDTVKTDKVEISGNKITNCGAGGTMFGGCGILLQQSGATAIIGNYITDTAYDGSKICGGINVSSSTRLVISGNVFDDNACDQVVVTGANEVIVTGNTFGYGGREGVVVSGAVGKAVVNGNVFMATAGTNDININLPSGDAMVASNTLVKAVALTAANRLLRREEAEYFTPTITAAAGTITTKSGSVFYQRTGRFVLVTIAVAITTNGTGAGAVQVSLPFTAAGGDLLGRENGVSGALVVGVPGGASISIRKFDNSYPGVDGAYITLSGLLTVA